MIKIPIEISARHLHISRKDLDKLFGKDYKLNKKRNLTQPGEFATKEIVDIQNGNNKIKGVRIVAPIRSKTQLEISKTDAFNLGLNVSFGHSGKVKGSGGIVLLGRKGKLKMKSGIIIPLRHLHCNIKEAEKFGIKNGDKVSVEVEGERNIIFKNILVRTGENYSLSMHLDTDEGNAAGINLKGVGIIV